MSYRTFLSAQFCTSYFGLLVVVALLSCGGEPDPPVIITDCEAGEDCTEDSNGDDPDQNGGSDDNGGAGEDFEPCSEYLEPCDPSVFDQGDYWCYDEENDGVGQCIAKCFHSGRVSNCPHVAAESFCLELDRHGNAGCFPSECSSHHDCDDGTCAYYGPYGNSFGRCYPDGPGESGDSCSGGPGGECGQGTLCIASTDGIERCRSLCNPWSSGGCMSWNEVCRPIHGDFGVCTDNITTDGSSSAFESCNVQMGWCSNAVQCLAAGIGNMCVRHCRDGYNDCDEISGEEALCNPYIVPGNDEGLCMPPCSNDSECADDEECVDQMCRQPCSSDGECCHPDIPDCSAFCADGYCL